jgi:NADPH:quinone reductase-like Zn-dependent oxidoreductase/NAD(P)-dependent dehydrogenase (short-subunit alcohol dehydrogenase family)
MKESAVPVGMDRMYISAECPQGAGAKYIGYTEGTSAEGRDLAGDIVLSDAEWSEPKVIISIAARKVTSGDSGNSSDAAVETKRTATPHWKEDFSFMETSTIEAFIRDNAEAAFPALEDSNAQLALWLDRACHKDATLRVLLVADTISADMQEILRQFGPEEGQILRFRQLTIAGKEAAIDRMKELSLPKLAAKYQKIDFETPVTEQNFSEDAFDLILVSTTAQAGAKQVGSALKPLLAQGGKLIFTTTTSSDIDDYAAWQAVYEEAGFESPALCLEQGNTVLAIGSTGIREESAIQYSQVVFLKRDTTSPALETAMEKLSTQLKAIGIQTEITTLSAIESVEEKAVISFLEAETPLIINWTSGELEQFKRLVLSTPYLIWITRGGQMIDSEALEFAPATGLLRTIRTEVPQITLPHIDLAPSIDLAASSTADLIMKVFNATVREAAQMPELEFVETRGKVLIPRVIENTSFDREIELHSANVRHAMAPLHQDGRPLKLEVGGSGSRWVEDDEAISGLANEDVEIKMSAVCLSGLDARAIAAGAGAIVGRQGTGVVVRVGSAVTRFAVGQEVAVLKAHSYRTLLRQDQSLVQALPASISATEGAALPTTYSAAYYALAEIARVSASDKLLIQAGSSSLGHAAVQIAKWKGAEIFVTADPASTQTLMDFGIPADHIFDERSDYKAQLKHAAGGLDVIFSSASGKPLRDLCALVNDYGRFVNVSSNTEAEQLASSLFTRNVSFTNIDLEHLFSSSQMSRLLKNVFELLDSKAIGAIPTASYSISQMDGVLPTIELAHEATVLTLDAQAVVPTTPPAPPALQLDPTATYLLSGGLGGLGPNIADTMYAAGARHLVFLSRSGARTPEQKAVLKKLESQGCKATALACDVSDANDMQKTMDLAARHSWKIKGVIQCAMVLRDSVLENMTYDKWIGATTCKIPGTWNLHSFLPQDMDFFIMLSSVVSVIGNTGQANYSAGNSYLDALAHFRANKGLAATALNIGLVTDATHFTEDFTIENFLQLYGHLVPVSVEDKEVNIALTATMRGTTADGVKVPTQVVVGIRGDLDREGTVTSLWPKDRKFDHRIKESGAQDADGKVPLKTLLANAKSLAEAAEAVESALRFSVASSMGSSPDEVDVDKPLHSFGSKSSYPPSFPRSLFLTKLTFDEQLIHSKPSKCATGSSAKRKPISLCLRS